LSGAPKFFAGAVVNPGGNPVEAQIFKMEKKIKAGASFFQTQAVYDVGAFEKFMKRVAPFKVPVLAGIILLKSAGMARFMNKNVAGVFVPEPLIQKMTKAEDRVKTSIEIAADLIKELKGLCQGVHIMPIGWESKVPAVLEAAKL
ncbi:MAG: methylenetetrahydrofolate reductase, partial [Deltaproteobacteria bacterium]|nr:methylenetetrahydrofolate reductase [Deltaproteobacteria bacterium]